MTKIPPLSTNRYVDMDELIDLPELIDLHPQICASIASSKRRGMNTNGTLLPGYPAASVRQAYGWFSQLPHDHPVKSAASRLDSTNLMEYLWYAVETVSVGIIIPLIGSSQPDRDDFENFAPLMEWLRRQELFATIDRAVVFTTPQNFYVPIHAHPQDDPSQEFIWIRPLLNKRFFLYDSDEATPQEARKKYIAGHSAWFNSCQYHGADPIPIAAYSFRVEGSFTDRVREIVGNAR